jgi:alkanesulfonate monooxygenase SsuD/methylene tetrahydromethanopterin reductase-like flavin-dependent oxidoreductase (luciferase family)
MTDYGRPLSFGVSIDPEATRFSSGLALAAQADRSGVDYLAVQDHPYQPAFLDSWTMLAFLLARSENISVVPDVLNLQLHPPTMVAKAAASLATMSGGRVQLGVGSGATPRGVAAMGGVPRTGDDAVAFTDEAIQVMRRALRGGTIQADTKQHRIAGYEAGPIPPQPIEVWLGSQGRKMLAVAGRSSDGWMSPLNIYVPPESVPERQALIDETARRDGRDPSAVRRIYNVIGEIGTSRAGTGLVGTVDHWIETLSEWAIDLGFDTFIFWTVTDPAAQLSVFTSEVIPGLRARVAELRGAA